MGNFFVFPVPKSSYKSVQDDPTLLFVPQKIETYSCGSFICSENRKVYSNIPCRYIPCQTRPSEYLIIFFHGNSEDIGGSLSHLLSSFGDRFSMDVLCPEYPTYGIYKKKDDSLSMDEAILQDARRVIKYCNKVLRFPYENIILIGRSLGTAVAVSLAAEYAVRGAVLISPFTAIRDIAKYLVGGLLSKALPDIFRSIDCVDKLKCPILYIHGEEDALIPHEMSRTMFEKTNSEKILKINKEMTHNQFRMESDVFLPIYEFMLEKLGLRTHLLKSLPNDYMMASDIFLDFTPEQYNQMISERHEERQGMIQRNEFNLEFE